MMNYKITYTVNNEEPNCMQCDHVCGWVWADYKGKTHDNCAEHCGAEHGWQGYQRTEVISE